MLNNILHRISTCPTNILHSEIPTTINPDEARPLALNMRVLLAVQVVVSMVSLPIILLAGLIEAAIRSFKCGGMGALREMTESLKNHLFIWIPRSLVCIFSSTLKLENFVKSNWDILFRYDSEITLIGHKGSAFDLSRMSNLQVFSCNKGRLTQAPDVSHNLLLRKLELRQNYILEAPNTSHNPNLEHLDLSKTELAKAPDVTQNPKLKKLELGWNQIEQIIDIRNNPNLEYVDLRNNYLNQVPDISQNPKLNYLNLSNNSLETLPDSLLSLPSSLTIFAQGNRFTETYAQQFIARLEAQRIADPTRGPCIYMSITDGELDKPNFKTPNDTELYFSDDGCPPELDLSKMTLLEKFSISGGPLTQVDFSHNPNLKKVEIFANQMTQVPNTRLNLQLERLELEGCQINQAPDVSHNLNLTYLSLKHNRLTQAPDVSQNQQLNQLNLSHNLLETLPDSILTLPRNCTVDVEGNRFSAQYVQEFQARLRAQRIADPTKGPTVYMSIYDRAASRNQQNPRPAARNHCLLLNELNSWEEHFNTPLDFAPLTSLDTNNQTLLRIYLKKLKDTADYTTLGRSRQNIIRRTENMLRLACENPEFKSQLLAILVEGSTNCCDKCIIFFNDIEVLWQILHKRHTSQEFAALAIRVERYELLKAHAKKVAVLKQLGDHVETTLYYQLKLKDAFNLPISTEHMLYPRVSGVTPEMLTEAQNEIGPISDIDLLSASELWRTHLKKDYAADFKSKYTEFSEQLENLPDNLNSQERKTACELILTNREVALKELTKRLTLQ